jgi:class 3 adenylate cyclase
MFLDWLRGGPKPPLVTENADHIRGTIPAKYVFLDIVGFTRNRSVEVQAEVVRILNRQVEFAIMQTAQGADKILIPTGDGMAIAILNTAIVDLHIKLALRILINIADHNTRQTSGKHIFHVRIGLNENADNIVSDINHRRNVAGAGISMAQRIMDKADENQILLGEATYIVLNPRDEYMGRFRKYQATDKHGEPFAVYQYLGRYPCINTEIPDAFAPRPKTTEEPKFVARVAYYVGLARRHREFFLQKKEDPGRDYVGTILLWFAAHDASEARFRPPYESSHRKLWGTEKGATLEERYNHYRGFEASLLSELSNSIQQLHLYSYRDYFEGWNEGALTFLFVKDTAIDKLRTEWPDIASELGFLDDKATDA